MKRLLAEQVNDGLFDCRGILQSKPLAHRKDKVHGLWQQRSIQPEKILDDPFYPVSLDRTFEPAMNADSESVFGSAGGHAYHTEIIALSPSSLSVNLVVLPWFLQLTGFGERVLLHGSLSRLPAVRSRRTHAFYGRSAVRGDRITALELHGQPFAPLGSAIVDHGPAGLGLHPQAETVGPFSF